ncbi:MAG: T9SS type A sorting domain-containing protein [Syntrophorhabdus sp.]|nr:T9SS type A sorting domain-containing protein [Syntrophorhabdus sp.]
MHIAIYPNPTNQVLNVYAENYQKVDILNFLGQVVYSNQVTENQFQINVSDLSSGVYFIRLSGENTTTKKFVKE